MDKKIWGLVILSIAVLAILTIKPKISHINPKQVIDQYQATASAKLFPIPTPTPAQNQIPTPSGRQLKVPILLYHYIGNNPNPDDKARATLSVPADNFDEQMGYLSKNGYHPVTLDTLLAALYGQITLSDKPIVITFDDGYVDLYYNAYPILQKYSFRAVAFIPTGLVGTQYYASWDQLSQMQSSGLLSFQSHTVSHTNLPSLSAQKLLFELAESKKTLESKFKIPVNMIAYPYGTSNSMVWQAAKQAGYLGGLGTWHSTIQSEGTIYNMPRVKVGGTMDIETFASKL